MCFETPHLALAPEKCWGSAPQYFHVITSLGMNIAQGIKSCRGNCTIIQYTGTNNIVEWINIKKQEGFCPNSTLGRRK
jgi:hypothetical protein